ncbi:glycosyltransferase family 4 protein [Kribbia dieselivorans]|uniref:glycosyltransferase family 4 protein n=1 Tax=Kribbia dieselivorans TaxID=331526 RepID=UPI000837C1C1|nr:glycosyltransferase family 4 protein [Kribbia dieselivorans]
MRIALVHSFYGSAIPSGENVVVEQQAAALTTRGHEVNVVSVRTDDLAQQRGYAARAAINVATGRGWDPTPALSDAAPDVVHVHNLFPNIATTWLRDWPGPVVCTVHNFRPACANGLLRREGRPCTLCPDDGSWHAVQHACYRGSAVATLPLAIRNRRGPAADALLARADAIICPGEHVEQVYAGWDVPAHKLHVIPHFTPAPTAGASSADRGEFVMASRLSPEKGVLDLLRVWPVEVPLAVYGGGPLQAEVEALCRGAIRFAGHVSPQEVSAAIAGAPAVVIPSTWLEIGPLTYGESLAQGTPVIAVDGNAAALDVRRSGAGVAVPDFAGIPAAVAEILAHRERYAAAARARYRERYTVEAWLTRTEALYTAVTG